MSNANLRKVMEMEYKKCLLDATYFIKKYVLIQHPTKGRVEFKLYPYQETTLKEFQENDRNIVLKSRQMGISTLCAAYILWLMVFHTDKNCLIISKTQDAAKEVVTKVRFANDNLPSWLKVEATEDNRLSLRLKNGSQVKSVSSSKDSARSGAISLLIMDEAAFMEYSEDIWTAAQPTLSTGGRAIVLSTPNGTGNWFHKMWVDGESGKNGFNTIRLKWNLHPERDQAWRDKQTENLGVRQAAQECDTDFSSSGNTVIRAEDIAYYEERIIPPVEKRGPLSEFWIWKYVDYNRSYMLVADVARGDGTDWNAFQIIDVETLEQIGEYEGKMSTKEYGRFLVSVATEYNKAILIVENASYGWAVIQEIIDLGYDNLFYSSSDLLYVDVESQMTNKINADERKMLPGFTTSGRSRPLVISKLELSMQEKRASIKSARLVEQLKTFIWKGSKAEAAPGYNDDIIMSYGISMWVRDTALRLRTQSIELTRTMLGGIGSSIKDNTGFNVGGVYRSPNAPARNPWEMQIGGRSESLNWLIR